jgi:hypothetical protein
LTPSNGKFFYVDFNNGDIHGDFYLNLRIGSNKNEIKCWITTNEHYIAVISSDCKELCEVENKWDYRSSKTAVL